MIKHTALLFLLLVSSATTAELSSMPTAILRQIPAGHVPLQVATGLLDGDDRPDYLVAAAAMNEAQVFEKSRTGPPRPLLIFIQQPNGAFVLAQRNDNVVLRIHEGGQCDPFDEGGGLAIKNRYFTVEHEVACGQHWLMNVTFKWSAKANDWLLHRVDNSSFLLAAPGDKRAKDGFVELADTRKADKAHPVRFLDYRN